MSRWHIFRFLDKVHVAKRESKNGYGENGFSDEVELDARWNDTPTRVDDVDGNETIAEGVVYFKHDAEVSEGDRLRLDGETKSFVAHKVNTSRNTGGTRKLKSVYFVTNSAS